MDASTNRFYREPRPAVIPRIHVGCGGAVLWDLSGGYCTRCHAEGLDPDETERGSDEYRPNP